MSERAIVVGGGVGGIVSALKLAQQGIKVDLFEARPALGGLASAANFGESTFDGGPYILLDRERLRWGLGNVDIDLDQVPLKELTPAFTVTSSAGIKTSIFSSLDRTCEEFNQAEPGSGDRYRKYVASATKALAYLAPLLTRPHSRKAAITTGAFRAAPWILLSLQQQLQRFSLQGPSEQAVTIWTRMAGGEFSKAPGPMGLVPGLIHRDGAARPKNGIHQIIALLEEKLTAAGVSVHLNSKVLRINHDDKIINGITLANGETVDSSVVVCDVGASAAILDLAGIKPDRNLSRRLFGPLQSPGITAYLELSGTSEAEINFKLRSDTDSATAFIHNPDATSSRSTGRIVSPLSKIEANGLGKQGQQERLESMVSETWWQEGISSYRIAGTRLIEDWGTEFNLRDDAMNLIMARKQMLQGRLPHKIDQLPGLFLTGSWTHPGQWISFCSVSGVLAANEVLQFIES